MEPLEDGELRPAPVAPEVFESQIEPLVEEVTEMARSDEAKLRHGNYFVRGEPGAFPDPDGLIHCQCSLPKICPANQTINPYDSKIERLLLEVWELDHIITQAGLAEFVYKNATAVRTMDVLKSKLCET